MSRVIPATNGNYLQNAFSNSSAPTAYTFAVWAKCTEHTTWQGVFTPSDAGAPRLLIWNAETYRAIDDGALNRALGTAGTWQCHVVRWSAADGFTYISSGNTADSNAAQTTTLYGTAISAWRLGQTDANDAPFNGKITHFAHWARRLSDAEVTSLLGGANPTALADTSGRVFYYPLTGASLDNEWTPVAGYTAGALAVTGTVTSDGADNPTVDAPPSAAATLSSATATSIAQTTATIGCTSDSTTGTLYAVVTTSATPPSAAQVELGQDHTGAAAVFAANDATVVAGPNTFAATGLTANTAYYTYFVQDIGTAEYSNVLPGSFTTAEAAPSLTDETAVSIGTTTVTPRVTTDTGNGTLYYVVTPQAQGEPSNTQVEAGQNAAGTAPTAAGNQPVVSAGVITFAEVTGLSPGTAYRISYAHSGTPA